MNENGTTELIEHEITAIVLAGGESSRMGRDKALLNMGENTLLSHVCLIALEVATKVYVVTPWIEKYQSILPPNCQLVKEELVLNTRSNTPIIGFHQALQLVQTEWVLLLACDLPYLSSFQVKQWSKTLATVLPTEIALLPRHPKGWETLCGFYRSNARSSLKFYLDNGGRSFQGWLKNLAVRELKMSDRTCLFNCNTPADWKLISDR
ncbi:molybdenum cofactor guanylyltransferase [Waterburya agarophytonicola K14]|uniref:Molybdenum cofactor guanylyltransferase n=2 Tax=Waterburya TaxID=2886915 RepID=A0A964BP62_9CYAN|nr:molybdenum cofactor guanylyltransferase [Waterburya agarophytonicola KI4]